ncbi:MAG: DUF2125 domain-containing protein [Alphaproteobacteria bacterium]|nr:DUF2125 domain-containing protein [Alphaproteobacteria bacterium]
MFQRKYLIFLAVLVLVVLAWTAGWFWLADKLRNDIASFVEAQAENRIVLNWSGMKIAGFPIRFDTSFATPQGRWTKVDRSIFWRGADTSIRLFTEGPGIVSFSAPGQHSFRVLENDNDLLIDINAEVFKGRLEFDKSGRAVSLRGRAAPFQASIDGGPVVTIAETAFDWGHKNGESSKGEIYPDTAGDTLSVVLEQIDLTALLIKTGVLKTLGTKIETLSSRVALHGSLNPSAINLENLTRWRDAGGTLEVETFKLAWGALHVAGKGTMTVDQALQPVGSFSAQVAGLDKLLNLMESRGQIGRQRAAIARIALAVLTRTPASGGPPEATVPITIQDRMLSIGPIPLMKLDHIVWS